MHIVSLLLVDSSCASSQLLLLVDSNCAQPLLLADSNCEVMLNLMGCIYRKMTSGRLDG
jgi:hypothetical protein